MDRTEIAYGEEIGAIRKAQWVRLVDVFLLGPFMAYVGFSHRKHNRLEGQLLIVAATGTILYNAQNFMENKRILEKTEARVL